MNRIKLSTLSEDTKVIVDGESFTIEVSDILENIEDYRHKDLYTVTEHYATFNAKDIIGDAIEVEYCNGMYEDWDDNIRADIEDEDIKDIQKILDRILSRNPNANISYQSDKLIEVDM